MSIATIVAPFVCFICQARITTAGSGSATDPLVIAPHDNSDGQPCGQSGERRITA